MRAELEALVEKFKAYYDEEETPKSDIFEEFYDELSAILSREKEPPEAVTLEQVEKLITSWVKVARNNERVFVSWMENGGMAMEIAALRQPAEAAKPRASQPPAKPAAREPRCTCEEVLTSMDCPIHGHIARGALSEQKAAAPALQGGTESSSTENSALFTTNDDISPEEIAGIERGLRDLKAGRVKSIEQIEKEMTAPQGEAASEPTYGKVTMGELKRLYDEGEARGREKGLEEAAKIAEPIDEALASVIRKSALRKP